MVRPLAVGVLCALTPLPLDALTVAPDVLARGTAVHQRFLDSGASVVTTHDSAACMVSRRIDIERSDYIRPDGTAVAFADVVRSPASSVQAIARPGEEPRFRIQLKFSPRPGTPILLDLPGAPRDVADLLEPSGDSLLIEGQAARDMARAFADGARPVVRSLSRDTGSTVTDRLDAPDLAALADCADTLATTERADTPGLMVDVVFDARPVPETVATPAQMQACGMANRPEVLHLGRLRHINGFVSHTDKVFVAFDGQGAVDRVYIPGIFDADMSQPQDRRARVSRAADGNVPTEPNAVSGCIGSEVMALCYVPRDNGGHALTTCDTPLAPPDRVASRVTSPPPSGLPPRRFFVPPGGGFPPVAAITTSVSRTPITPPGEEPEVDAFMIMSTMSREGEIPPPPAVPLPPAIWLLLSALGALALGRRRRTA